ncbi:MAG: sigma-70 family RNA polymerase sigma factor [Armatimonadetes bacterium]|nr:sigma-70 family RNA polymerase sigma factor [Armatimonadota bacterium]
MSVLSWRRPWVAWEAPGPSLPWNLVQRAAAGNRQAVEQLVERYQDAVYSMAWTFIRDAVGAEDLAQEAWIRILRGLPGFRGECRFSTWVYRVVMNTFLNGLQKKIPEPQEEIAAAVPDGVDRLDTRMMVRDAVRTLPPEFRAVVVLRYIADLSYQQIASVLELPLGTVQSRLKRALDRLAKELRMR